MKRIKVFLTAAALITPVYGYIRFPLNYSDGSSAFIKRSDVAGIQFYLNSSVVAGAQSSATGTAVTVISAGSNPLLGVQAAQGTWNAVTTSTIRFVALKPTTSVINGSDGQNTIAIGSTAADLSVLAYKAGVSNGFAAVTINTAATFVSGGKPTGDVADSDVVLNPAFNFSTDSSTSTDLQAVMTHELGHALGLNHSGLLGATMFQYAAVNERYLSSDEISFASFVYPSKTASLSSISGKVAASDGSAVQSALVELIDTANGNSLTALTGTDGSYSLPCPAGSYAVYAEPLTGTSIVEAGNLYLPLNTVITSNFQPAALGGFSSPTLITVANASAATAPTLTVTGGSSSLSEPFLGVGRLGASGDIGVASNPVLYEAPVVIASGQSVDIGLIGGGIDTTVSITVIGQGVSVRPGSVRADPNIAFGGSLAGMPMMRASLDVAAHSAPTLATIVVTKGSSVLTLSGVLVLVPATPVLTSNAVVNAASSLGKGVVSPGGLTSLYDTVNSSLGPASGVLPPFDVYGNLSTSAGGVTVTFDGVAAPLDYVSGSQINLQVPFEVAGKTSTQVVVNYYGSKSVPVTLTVAPTQPAFFTFNGTVIAQNFPDYSPNTSTNPIARGGVVVLYGTGIGKPSYALGTGQPGVVPPTGYVPPTYSCSFGGSAVNAAYTYWYYGFVGLATWTVSPPANAPTGPVTLTCTDTASGAITPQGTIYLK